MPKANRYAIKPGFAKAKNIPTCITGVVVRQTPKAMYLVGHGDVGDLVCCIRCGRKLTHPVSRLVGIGPECGQHWWDESVLGPYGFTEAHAERLRQMVMSIKFEGWIPKSCVTLEQENVENVDVPSDHPMLTQTEKKPSKRTQRVRLATYDKNIMVITFPYDPTLVAQIKTLAGRRWNAENKHWTAPFSIDSVEKLQAWGFTIEEAILSRHASITKESTTTELVLPENLYDYQAEGIRFIEAKKGRAMLADEMGLGKTIQILAWLQAHPEVRPAIVVVPASVKLNWVKEARVWMEDPDLYVINGRPKATSANAADEWKKHRVRKGSGGPVIVINYDLLANKYKKTKSGRPKYEELPDSGGWIDRLPDPSAVILDECHYIKNRDRARSMSCTRLCKMAEHVLVLSGTPIENRPVEFYPAISLVEPGIFPSFWQFAQKYCGAENNGYGWDFTGVSNTEELHHLLSSTIMLRRLKKDVLTELPAKRRIVVPMEVSKADYKRYLKVYNEFKRWLVAKPAKERGKVLADSHQAGSGGLTMIEEAKQLAVLGKLASATEWIKDYLDSGNKLVIFATHKGTLTNLERALKDYNPVKLDGSTRAAARQEVVDTFQNDNSCRVFLGNIKAAGVGITLTAASATCFLELGWTPGAHDQAEDRVHRIGQEADSVEAYYLVAENTVEEDIVELLDEKRKVLDAVLDGRATEDDALLVKLMEKALKEIDQAA